MTYLESIHNRHVIIEALAIREMLRESEDDTDAALADLEETISIAQPSR